jgi:hypothetical protein
LLEQSAPRPLNQFKVKSFASPRMTKPALGRRSTPPEKEKPQTLLPEFEVLFFFILGLVFTASSGADRPSGRGFLSQLVCFRL